MGVSVKRQEPKPEPKPLIKSIVVQDDGGVPSNTLEIGVWSDGSDWIQFTTRGATAYKDPTGKVSIFLHANDAITLSNALIELVKQTAKNA